MNDTNLSQPEDSMREYLSKVSYNQSNLILALAVILLGVDLVLTLVHSLQELKGVNAPLWRYFGAIIGVQIPDWLGFPVFFVLLTVVLWAVGLAGIIGYVPFLEKERRDKWAIAAVGVLIGARISDGIFSHIRLWNLGYKPNPGLESIPYYFAEALFLIILEDYPTPLELARYKQEYEIVRNLHLDCAIAAYGLEKYQNTLAIVLEDFGGVSLNLLINNQKLTLKEFLKLAIKIAESLGAIHTANIIHKDINPSNIVFNPETGLLKIIDFGISTISPKTLWT